jgi:hypothetical protein
MLSVSSFRGINPNYSSKRTASPPLNSSVRRQSVFPAWFLAHFSRLGFVLAKRRLPFLAGLRCCLSCAWSLSRLARVGAHRLFVLCRARGSLRRGVCRQRFVLRAQARSFVALPGIQSSVIVLVGDGASCCRLTSRSRRTAAPPLNSSVRPHGQDPTSSCTFNADGRGRCCWVMRHASASLQCCTKPSCCRRRRDDRHWPVRQSQLP